MPLIEHPRGDYRFLPGIAPYSCGVIASPGFEIVHVTLQRLIPWRAGFDRVAAHLASEGRPQAALCAMELRSPRPFTFEGFARFNAQYAAVLESWGLFVEGVNPIARANLAPERDPPAEPSLYGFSYTRPAAGAEPTFVVAGAGELPEGVLAAEGIVARGDLSPAGLDEKARFVVGLMEGRLHGLGSDWPLVTDIDVYTIHPTDALMPILLDRMPPARRHGLHCHHTRPPIEEVEFEMDLRGVRTELRI